MGEWADGQATQPVLSHMYVLLGVGILSTWLEISLYLLLLLFSGEKTPLNV